MAETLVKAGTVREYVDKTGKRRHLVALGWERWRCEDGKEITVPWVQRQRQKVYAGKLRNCGWVRWNPWEAACELRDYPPVVNQTDHG